MERSTPKTFGPRSGGRSRHLSVGTAVISNNPLQAQRGLQYWDYLYDNMFEYFRAMLTTKSHLLCIETESVVYWYSIQ